MLNTDGKLLYSERWMDRWWTDGWMVSECWTGGYFHSVQMLGKWWVVMDRCMMGGWWLESGWWLDWMVGG